MKAYQLEYWLSLGYSTQKTLKKLLSVAWSVLNSLSSFAIRGILFPKTHGGLHWYPLFWGGEGGLLAQADVIRLYGWGHLEITQDFFL